MLLRNFTYILLIGLLFFTNSLQVAGKQLSETQVDSLLQIWHDKNNPVNERIDAMSKAMRCFTYIEIPQDSLDFYCDKHLQIVKKHGKQDDIADGYYSKIYYSHITGHHEKVLELSNEFLALDLKNVLPNRKARILIQKARALETLAKTDEALVVLDQILEINKLSKEILYQTYGYISIIYMTNGKFNLAINAINKSYQYINDISDPLYKKHIYYNNLAVIFDRMGDKDQAIKYQIEAIEMFKLMDSEQMAFKYVQNHLVRSMSNLSSIYIDINEYKKAKANIDTTLTLAIKYELPIKIFLNKVLSADIYIKQDSLAKAEKMVSEAEKYLDMNLTIDNTGVFFLAKGELKLAQENYAEAFLYCKKSYEIFKERSFINRQKLCSDCLQQVFERQNKFEEALSWLKVSKMLQDSISSTENMNKMAALKIDQQHEREIAILEERAKSEKNNKIFFVIIFIGTFILAMSFLSIYFTEKKKRSLLQQQNKLLEENLENKTLIEVQSKELKKQEKQKSNFLANIAHEIQTPLTIISGQSKNLLKREDISINERQTLSTIARNSRDLSLLTRQLIETTKNEKWKVKTNIDSFYFYEILNPIVSEFEYLAKEKNIDFQFDLNNTQNLQLQTDANKLRVIISNIISNAIRYSEPNKSIKVNCITDLTVLNIVVEDQGIGISEKELPKIFDRFYQSDHKTLDFRRDKSGFGIGLSVCKEYTEMLGGTLTAESKLNIGSKFFLNIPIHLQELNNNFGIIQKSKLINNAEGIKNKILASTVNAPTILIVEDNKDIWLFLQNLFEQKYNLHFTSNGKEALSHLKNEETPNLIITDIMMPYMDGLSLIKTLKSDEKLSLIPLLVMTARFDLEDELSSLSLNIDDYIIKPFDDSYFLSRINYLLNLTESRLSNITDNNINNSKLTKSEKEWLLTVETIVRDSLYDINFSSESVADQLNLSHVHLNRKLKSLTGFTMSKYILEARLRIALDLIERKEVTLVKEACYRVGIKSPRSFTRAFKQRFGKYPSDFFS